jgi:hypothetical protein
MWIQIPLLDIGSDVSSLEAVFKAQAYVIFCTPECLAVCLSSGGPGGGEEVPTPEA